mmetsp:Transcript_100725/g.291168  ORF Transcript_100725/g.291168 Transcript_100725/m.291168 type:complete len:255 (-) Transcript_100725:880-1644(-)
MSRCRTEGRRGGTTSRKERRRPASPPPSATFGRSPSTPTPGPPPSGRAWPRRRTWTSRASPPHRTRPASLGPLSARPWTAALDRPFRRQQLGRHRRSPRSCWPTAERRIAAAAPKAAAGARVGTAPRPREATKIQQRHEGSRRTPRTSGHWRRRPRALRPCPAGPPPTIGRVRRLQLLRGRPAPTLRHRRWRGTTHRCWRQRRRPRPRVPGESATQQAATLKCQGLMLGLASSPAQAVQQGAVRPLHLLCRQRP